MKVERDHGYTGRTYRITFEPKDKELDSFIDWVDKEIDVESDCQFQIVIENYDCEQLFTFEDISEASAFLEGLSLAADMRGWTRGA